MTVAVTSILTEIETRLNNITTTNGYNYTVNKVELSRLEAFKGYDLPAIRFFPTAVTNERAAYDNDKRTLSISIYFYELTRDEAFTDVADKLAWDVVNALHRKDTHPKISDDPDYCLTGTVSDIVFQGYDYMIGEGQKPFCGTIVNFDIIFFTDVNDMSSYS